jgi:hypothetical protein
MNIPTVGLPLKAHWGQAVAVITCLCKEKNEPILIRGTDLGAVCQHCNAIYQITKVEFEAGPKYPNGPLVSVSRVGFMPKVDNGDFVSGTIQ